MEEKILLGRYYETWDDNTKMEVKAAEWDGANWIHLI
jgi:hypothetical protein